MRIAVGLGLTVGLFAMVWLIVRQGAGPILALLTSAGPALLWLVPLRGLPLIVDVFGWRLLLPPRTRFATLMWIAIVRESVSRLLPMTIIGGEIIGIRLLVQNIPDTAAAVASVVVETLLTQITQLSFAVLGLLCLWSVTGKVTMNHGIVASFVLVTVLVVGLTLGLKRGSVFSRLARLARRLLGAGAKNLTFLDHSVHLDAAIARLTSARKRVAASGTCQFAGLVLGSAETWLALRLLGHPVGVASAIALESLTLALRNFVFFVPAGLGVQEAGLVGLGHLLGLPSETAIALSLAKRMRELLIGVPTLLAWYFHEGRRELRQRL